MMTAWRPWTCSSQVLLSKLARRDEIRVSIGRGADDISLDVTGSPRPAPRLCSPKKFVAKSQFKEAFAEQRCIYMKQASTVCTALVHMYLHSAREYATRTLVDSSVDDLSRRYIQAAASCQRCMDARYASSTTYRTVASLSDLTVQMPPDSVVSLPRPSLPSSSLTTLASNATSKAAVVVKPG